MDSFDAFEQNLREMLAHLYDPAFRPTEAFWYSLGLQRDEGIDAIRDAILTAVEKMKPSERVPLSARAWRIYGMLRYRYVENLPQEVAAERLGISARHLRREMSEAVHALALHLWETQVEKPDQSKRPVHETAQREDTPPSESGSESEPGDIWQAQLRRELEALVETGASAVAGVRETVDAVMKLGQHLTNRRKIELAAGEIAPELSAAIHPSALRQILLWILDRVSLDMSGGTIRLDANQIDHQVRIEITAVPALAPAEGDFAFLHEFLQDQGGTLGWNVRGDGIQFHLELLVVDRIVLVVDDNLDIVHLYRRYVAGTRYYIQHIHQGSQLFTAVEAYHPDVIVLDVMLPDIDGWDLLSRLHESPSTRSIPVVICSVIRERELALALGASAFLSKPVQRSNFLTALDTVLSPA